MRNSMKFSVLFACAALSGCGAFGPSSKAPPGVDQAAYTAQLELCRSQVAPHQGVKTGLRDGAVGVVLGGLLGVVIAGPTALAEGALRGGLNGSGYGTVNGARDEGAALKACMARQLAGVPRADGATPPAITPAVANAEAPRAVSVALE